MTKRGHTPGEVLQIEKSIMGYTASGIITGPMCLIKDVFSGAHEGIEIFREDVEATQQLVAREQRSHTAFVRSR